MPKYPRRNFQNQLGQLCEVLQALCLSGVFFLSCNVLQSPFVQKSLNYSTVTISSAKWSRRRMWMIACKMSNSIQSSIHREQRWSNLIYNKYRTLNRRSPLLMKLLCHWQQPSIKGFLNKHCRKKCCMPQCLGVFRVHVPPLHKSFSFF